MDSGDHHRLKEYLSRKGMRSLDNHSDDSETSSVCSERSFDSYRRPSDVSSICEYEIASYIADFLPFH